MTHRPPEWATNVTYNLASTLRLRFHIHTPYKDYPYSSHRDSFRHANQESLSKCALNLLCHLDRRDRLGGELDNVLGNALVPTQVSHALSRLLSSHCTIGVGIYPLHP